MANLVNRNRQAYDSRIQALIRAMARAFLNGDEDKAWEMYFQKLEKTAQESGQPVNPSKLALLWFRPLKKY